VRAGLQRIGAGEARPGIRALRAIAELPPAPTTAADVSFKLAPRINAAGRLGDPSIALELLLADDEREASRLAAELEVLQRERRRVEREVTEAAHRQVLEVYGERPTGGVVVAAEGWHRGVVGITAARLVDRFRVPVVAIALHAGVGHGSARAPEGFRLYDALEASARELEVFGGHQAAAGLTVRAARIDAFRALFASASREFVPASDLPEVDVTVDGASVPVPPARDLDLLEPLGAGNAPPVFALRDVEVLDRGVVGGEGEHLKLKLRIGRGRIAAFGFEQGHRIEDVASRIDAVGHLQRDVWRGGEGVELRLL
jgi:single-stranded-DNA-specific exonuclease